jgi:predicted esterase
VKTTKSSVIASLVLKAIVLSVAAGATVDTNTYFKHPQAGPTKMPRLPQGGTLNLTFKSKIDGSLQSLLLKVPSGYTPKKSWPLLVTLHGLGDGSILATDVESMVQIGPYGRGSVWFTGIGAQDVFEAVEMAKKLFVIDENRLYLCGFSMGAIATFDLGLRYQDIWAACVPVCGRCDDLDLVENGKNLPFWIHAGNKDLRAPPQQSKSVYLKARHLGLAEWKYTEHKNMPHSFSIDWKPVQDWLLTKARPDNPKQVAFCLKSLRSNRAYWIKVTEIAQYGKNARITAAIDGQKITITTDNIANYTLNLEPDLVDLSRTIQIEENGLSVFKGLVNKDGRFVKSARNKNAVLKRPGLSGPLWDIYSSPCLLVYGTNSKDKRLILAAKRSARSFSNPKWMNSVTFPIVPDTAVTDQDIAQNNLVLFGNARTNSILARISQKLPVKMHANRVVADADKYTAERIGYVLIYPNPLNTQKYVAIFAGNHENSIASFDTIWPHFDSVPRDVDFAVFELAGHDSFVTWHQKKLFGTSWNWQPDTSDPCLPADPK